MGVGTNTNRNEELFLQWHFAEYNADVIIEECHGAVYAYLLKNNQIVSDVWLYNLCTTPSDPPWKNDKGRGAPYLNSKQYTNDTIFVPSDPELHLFITVQNDVDSLLQAKISIQLTHEKDSIVLLAILSEGNKPGMCANAKMDGPLAKRIE